MKKTDSERQRARLKKIIDEMNNSKVETMLTILRYVEKLSSGEIKDFRAISKSKGFSAKLFAQRLREAGDAV